MTVAYTACIMCPGATSDPVARCVSLSVHLSVTRLRCAKTSERIEVLSGVETLVDLKHTVLDGVPTPYSMRDGESGKS